MSKKKKEELLNMEKLPSPEELSFLREIVERYPKANENPASLEKIDEDLKRAEEFLRRSEVLVIELRRRSIFANSPLSMEYGVLCVVNRFLVVFTNQESCLQLIRQVEANMRQGLSYRLGTIPFTEAIRVSKECQIPVFIDLLLEKGKLVPIYEPQRDCLTIAMVTSDD